MPGGQVDQSALCQVVKWIKVHYARWSSGPKRTMPGGQVDQSELRQVVKWTKVHYARWSSGPKCTMSNQSAPCQVVKWTKVHYAIENGQQVKIPPEPMEFVRVRVCTSAFPLFQCMIARWPKKTKSTCLEHMSKADIQSE